MSSPAVAALQTALAAEYAAVYGYGVAGAHLAAVPRRLAAAQRDWALHEAARDRLSSMLTALGAVPAPAAVSYALPFPVRSPRAAVALAALLEDRVTTAYLGVVALTDPGLRAFGARSVRTAALRAAAWRGGTVAFPGLDGPASGPARANAAPAGP